MATRTALSQVALRLFANLCRRAATFWRTKSHSCPASFRKANGNRLLRGTRTVFAFAYMVHFFADEFARLSRRRLSLFLVAFGAFQRFFFRYVAPIESIGWDMIRP